MKSISAILFILIYEASFANKSKWISSPNLFVADGATVYISPVPRVMTGADATEGLVQMPIPTGGTIRKLRIYPPAGATGTNSAIFTLRVNGSDTSLTTTVTGTTNASDEVNSASASAGDLISIKVVGTGGGGINGYYRISLEFEATISGETVIFSLGSLAGAARYLSLGSQMTGAISATATDVEIVMPFSGTLKKLYVTLTAAPGAGKSRTFHTSIDGATSGDITLVISETSTSGNETATDVAVSAGDRISIRSFGTNSPAASSYALGIVLIPATPGQFLIPWVVGPTGLSTGSTEYAQLMGGRTTVSTTESDVYSPGSSDFQIVGARAYLVTAPGAGTSRVIKLRENASDASVPFTMTISGTDQTATASGTFTPADWSNLTTQFSIGSGTPAASKGMVSYIGYIAPSAASRNKGGDFMPFFQ